MHQVEELDQLLNLSIALSSKSSLSSHAGRLLLSSLPEVFASGVKPLDLGRNFLFSSFSCWFLASRCALSAVDCSLAFSFSTASAFCCRRFSRWRRPRLSPAFFLFFRACLLSTWAAP